MKQFFNIFISLLISFQVTFANAANLQCSYLFAPKVPKNNSNVSFETYNHMRDRFERSPLLEDKFEVLAAEFDSKSPEMLIAFFDSILGRDYYLSQFIEHSIQGKKDSFFSYKNNRTFFLPKIRRSFIFAKTINFENIDRILMDFHGLLNRLILKDNWAFTPNNMRSLKKEIHESELAAYEILRKVEDAYFVEYKLPKSDLRKNRLNLLSWIKSLIPFVLHPLQQIKLNMSSYEKYKNNQDIQTQKSILINHYISVLTSRIYKLILLVGFGAGLYVLYNAPGSSELNVTPITISPPIIQVPANFNTP